ncbi:MAG: sulfatase-like hydrolase/transferase [Bacteroidetes bacterium]|nr:sulfatase-like hydrolase/transferase [Bacteroidota bacterium]
MYKLLIIAFFLSLLEYQGLAQIKSQRPNIILIMADDLGYGDIACYGSKKTKTPVLDKMASEGMKFTDFHSNGAVCTPTRAALITGNYQQKAGLEAVIYVQVEKRIYGIQADQITMPELFKEAGYKTGMFGKWHLGYEPEYNPIHHGFDEFYGYMSGNVDYISHRDGIGKYDWWRNLDSCYDKGYVTDLITDEALKFMENNKKQAFFLYLPHEAPHFPYQGRNDKADRLPGQKFEGKGSRPDKKEAYKEMVEIMDENIGRIFNKLKELDLDKNTMVLFCSDNGATKLGENGELQGFKSSLWEGGHRVPAIAWYPEKIKSGTVTASTILSMDILPTFLSIANISTNTKFDGQDFSKVLFDNENLKERPVFWRYRNQYVVRKGDWKYLKIKEKEYLFNLKNDIKETINMKNSQPDKTKEFKLLLSKWGKEMSNYTQQTK